MKVHQMLLFPLHGCGSGVYVDQLAAFLVNRDHQVKVLCCDHYPAQKQYPSETILFNSGENGVFDLDFNFPAFTSHPLSVKTTFGSLTADRRRAYVRVFSQKIHQEVASFRPDIVHIHHGWVIGAVLADMSVPYVVSLHGTEHYGFEHYPDYRDLALHGLRGARMVIALTEEDREQAIRAYDIDPQRTTVIKSGVDSTVFKPVSVDRAAVLRSHRVPISDRPVVFFGGKLTALKGVDILLRAAAIYSRSDERPITLIAGDGDMRAELEHLAAGLGLDRVHFLGYQDRQRLIELINIADVGAFPSLQDRFPLVALETLACGTPIVATEVGGFPQIVAAHVGALVRPGDPAALAERIAAFIGAGFKARARERILAHVRQNLNWERTVSGIERVYERVLARD
jgi:glycosyltransferase involved in cell wall biosynthesis